MTSNKFILKTNNYIFIVDDIDGNQLSNFIITDKTSFISIYDENGILTSRTSIDNEIKNMYLKDISMISNEKNIIVEFYTNEYSLFDKEGKEMIIGKAITIDFIDVTGDSIKEIIIDGGGMIIDIEYNIIDTLDVEKFVDIDFNGQKDLITNESGNIAIIFSNGNKMHTDINIEKIDKLIYISQSQDNLYYYVMKNETNSITAFEYINYNRVLWSFNFGFHVNIKHVSTIQKEINVIFSYNSTIQFLVNGIIIKDFYNNDTKINFHSFNLINHFTHGGSVYFVCSNASHPYVIIINESKNRFLKIDFNENGSFTLQYDKYLIFYYALKQDIFILNVYDIFKDAYIKHEIAINYPEGKSDEIGVLVTDLNKNGKIDILIGTKPIFNKEI